MDNVNYVIFQYLVLKSVLYVQDVLSFSIMYRKCLQVLSVLNKFQFTEYYNFWLSVSITFLIFVHQFCQKVKLSIIVKLFIKSMTRLWMNMTSKNIITTVSAGLGCYSLRHIPSHWCYSTSIFLMFLLYCNCHFNLFHLHSIIFVDSCCISIPRPLVVDVFEHPILFYLCWIHLDILYHWNLILMNWWHFTNQ